jgi:hypothetical protein
MSPSISPIWVVIATLISLLIFIVYAFVMTLYKIYKSPIAKIAKTLLFLIKYVRVTPCFRSKIITSTNHFGNWFDFTDYTYLFLFKIRIKKNVRYLIYNKKSENFILIKEYTLPTNL